MQDSEESLANNSGDSSSNNISYSTRSDTIETEPSKSQLKHFRQSDPWENINLNLSKVLEDDLSSLSNNNIPVVTSSDSTAITSVGTGSSVEVRASAQNRHFSSPSMAAVQYGSTSIDKCNGQRCSASVMPIVTAIGDYSSKDMLGDLTTNILTRYMISNDNKHQICCSPPPGLGPLPTSSPSVSSKASSPKLDRDHEQHSSSLESGKIKDDFMNTFYSASNVISREKGRHNNEGRVQSYFSKSNTNTLHYNRHSIASISELTNHNINSHKIDDLSIVKLRKSDNVGTPPAQANRLLHLLSSRLCMLEECSSSIDKKIDMYEYHCRKKLEDCRDQMKKRIDELVEDYGKQIGVTIKSRRKSLQILERNVDDHLATSKNILTQAKLKLNRLKITKEDIFTINDVLFDCLLRTKKLQRDSSEFNYWLDFIPSDPLESDSCIGILQYSEQDEPIIVKSQNSHNEPQNCCSNRQSISYYNLKWDASNGGCSGSCSSGAVNDSLESCKQSQPLQHQTAYGSTTSNPTLDHLNTSFPLNLQAAPAVNNTIHQGFAHERAADVSAECAMGIKNFNSIQEKTYPFCNHLSDSAKSFHHQYPMAATATENCPASTIIVNHKAILANRRNSWHPMMHPNATYFSTSKPAVSDLMNNQHYAATAANNNASSIVNTDQIMDDMYSNVNRSGWNANVAAAAVNQMFSHPQHQQQILASMPYKNYIQLLPTLSNHQHAFNLNNSSIMQPQLTSFDDSMNGGPVALRKATHASLNSSNRKTTAGSAVSSLLTLDMQRPRVVDCYGEPLRHLKCIKGLSFMSYNRLLICENGRRNGHKNVLMFSLTGSFLNYINPTGCQFINPTGICVMQYGNSSLNNKGNVGCNMFALTSNSNDDNVNDTNEQNILVVDGTNLKLINSNTCQIISIYSLDNTSTIANAVSIDTFSETSSQIVQDYKPESTDKPLANAHQTDSASDVSGTAATFQRQDRYGGLYAIDNVVYICDRKAPSVKVFDIRTSSVVTEWTSPEIINPNFVYRKNDYAYVSDSSTNKVIKLNTCDGKKIGELTSSNSSNNKNLFNNPSGLCDDGDNLAVADLYNNRIQLFSKDCLIGSIYSPCIESPFSISYHPMGVMAISNGRPRTVTLYFTMLS